MNVLEKHITIDEDEMMMALEIHIDGELAFKVSDGEPEDSNLCRDFGACYSIGHLLQKAYDAGKAGEEFDHEVVEEMYEPSWKKGW